MLLVRICRFHIEHVRGLTTDAILLAVFGQLLVVEDTLLIYHRFLLFLEMRKEFNKQKLMTRKSRKYLGNFPIICYLNQGPQG